MEKLISSLPYFYGASKDRPNTIQFLFKMKGPICREMLRWALDNTMAAFPYFGVRPVIHEERIMLEANPQPVVMTAGKESIPLGGAEARGHLLSVGYAENCIDLNFFHGLTDGRGIFPFIRTLFYYYGRERYGQNTDSPGVLLKGRRITSQEIRDPYPESVDSTIRPAGKVTPKPAFNLSSAGLVTPGETYRTLIKISEAAFMQYTRNHEGSPAVMAALFMARAIDTLHPERQKPVIAGMALDIRNSLGAPRAHQSLVSQIYLEYKEAMKKMDFQNQVTCFRGMVMVQSQRENILDSVRNNLALIRAMDAIESLEERRQTMQNMMGRFLNQDTFKVSYTGKLQLEDAESYLDSVQINLETREMLIEILAINGYFYFSILQGWQESVYVRAFTDELRQAGIAFEAQKPEKVQTPGIAF